MDKYSMPPDWVFPSRVAAAKKKQRAYKPTGVKYPDTGVIAAAIGKPDQKWTYFVPWSTQKVVVFRYNRPDQPPKFRVLTEYHGGWYICWPPSPFLLFHKQDLLEQDVVYVCEGEPNACVAISMGLAATTSLGGPTRASLTDWTPLEEKQVVILPDQDEAGMKYAEDVARLVLRAGARSVKIVLLPGVGEGEGLHEWYYAHSHSSDDVVLKAEIEALTAATPYYQPPDSTADSADAQLRPALQCLAEVAAEPLDWVWDRVVPQGTLTLVTGESGVGKSLLAAEIVAAVTQGRSGPTATVEREPGAVLLVSNSAGLAKSVRPRLEAAGADLSRIYCLDALWEGLSEQESDDDDDADLPPLEHETPAKVSSNRDEELERPLRQLEQELLGLCESGWPIRLVLIDPIWELAGELLDEKQIFRLANRLLQLAERLRVAIVVVAETGLSRCRTGRPGLPLGNLKSLPVVARSVWSVVRDLDDPRRRLVLPVKTNFCEGTSGLAYSIGDRGLEWETRPIPLTGGEYVTQLMDRDQIVRAPETRTGIERAEQWLLEQLGSGPVESIIIQQRAAADKISDTTLRRAFWRLGGRAGRELGAAHWHWRLPEAHARCDLDVAAVPDQLRQAEAVDEVDQLDLTPEN